MRGLSLRYMETGRVRGFISSGIWRQDWSGVSLLGYMETEQVNCLSLVVHGDRTGGGLSLVVHGDRTGEGVYL